jgi:hypothetical protein
MSTPKKASSAFNASAGKIVSLSEFRAAIKKTSRKEIGILRRAWGNVLQIISLPVMIPVNIVQVVRDAKAGKKKEEVDVYLPPESVAKIEKNPLAAFSALKQAFVAEEGIRKMMEEQDPSGPQRFLDKFSGLAKRRKAVVEKVLSELPDHSAQVAAGKLVLLNLK